MNAFTPILIPNHQLLGKDILNIEQETPIKE